MFEMKARRFGLLAIVAAAIGFVSACSPGSPEPTAVQATAIVEKDSTGLSPVFRFAKISNGAYFYTASAQEVEYIIGNVSDFRYEGVAFQQVTGGAPVYRFANLDTRGYFYTANEAEKAYVQTLKQWRFEGLAFSVPTSGGLPVYRLANVDNGAYLYTTSQDEYNYAQTLPSWRGEGQVFQAPSQLQLSGTVSDGAAWAAATVSIKDRNGLTRTTTTSTIGNYFIDVSGMQPPLMALATKKTPGPSSDFLLSVRPSLPSNTTTTTMNVTPLTNAVAHVIGSNPLLTEKFGVQFWSDPSVWLNQVTMEATYAKALTLVRTVFASRLSANGIPPNDYDPIKLAFAANDLGQSAMLQEIQVSPTGKGIWFTNLLTTDASTASLYINEVNASNPPSLPASTVGRFPKTKLVAIAASWKACLAVPAAQRISLNANGTVASVHPTCSAVGTPDYLASGSGFGDAHLGLLGEPRFDANSEVDVRFRNYTNIDGKQLVGVAVSVAGSQAINTQFIQGLSFRNNTWEVSGNQRGYAGTATARTTIYSRPSTSTVAANENSLSAISMIFDPTHPSLANIRLIRVKGPGLPQLGLVYARSAGCSTEQFMAIMNKTGTIQDTSLPTPANYLWTTGTTPNFNLSRENRVGTQTWPSTDRAYADSNAIDPASLVPPFAKYTVELFDFSTATSPLSTYTTNLIGVVVNPYYYHDAGYSVRETTNMATRYLSLTGVDAGARTSVDFEWQYTTTAFKPRISALQAFSNTRNLAITDGTRLDYFSRSASFYFNRQFVNQSTTSYTKDFETRDLLNGTQTNPTTLISANNSTQAPNNNTTCSGTPQLRALVGTVGNSDYREFTFRTVGQDSSQVNYTSGIQY